MTTEDIRFTASTSDVDRALKAMLTRLKEVEGAVKTINSELSQFGGKNFRTDLAKFSNALKAARIGDPISALNAARAQGDAATIRNRTTSPRAEQVNAYGSAYDRLNRANRYGAMASVAGQVLNQGDLTRLTANAEQLRSLLGLLRKASTDAFQAHAAGAAGAAGASRKLSEAVMTVENRLKQMRQEATTSTDALRRQTLQAGQAVQDRSILGRAKTGDVSGFTTDELRRAEKLVGLRATYARGLAEELRLRGASESRIKMALNGEQRMLATQQQLTAELRKQKAVSSWDASMERLNANGGANLLALQARLIANYSVIGALTGTLAYAVGFVKDFDKELVQLQAIAAMSDESMKGLKERIVEVSQEFKFTAVEVAQAATILAQAGFSASEIGDSLKGVALLATATGSSLAESVDVATAAIGVFNMQASEMERVANVTTSALNLSKLTMNKLATSLQYSANIAADAGVTYTELTAVLAAMANTGIRSGSTMGTGMRQLLIELTDPSKKLKERLDELGITLDQIDLKTQGFQGVLDNLRKGGFTSADAFATMETRTAAAFSAIARGADQIQTLERAFLLSNAAAEANEKQMRGLDTLLKVMASNFGALADAVGQDLLNALKGLVKTLSDLFKALRENADIIKVFVNALAGVAAVGVMKILAGMAAGVLRLSGVMVGATVASTGMTAATTALSTSVARTGFAAAAAAPAVRGFMAAMGPWGLAAAAVGAAFAFMPDLLGSVGAASDKTAKNLDRARSVVEGLRGEVESLSTAISTVSDDIERYANRADKLSESSGRMELDNAILRSQIRFGAQGFDVQVGASYDELAAGLRKVRDEQERLKATKLGETLEAQRAQVEAMGAELRQVAASYKEFGKGTLFGVVPYSEVERTKGRQDTAATVMSILDKAAAGQEVSTSQIETAVARMKEARVQLGERLVDGSLNTFEKAQAQVDLRVMEMLEEVSTNIVGKIRGKLGEEANIVGKIRGKLGEEANITANQAEKLAADFSTTEVGKAMRDLIDNHDRLLSTLTARLKQADTPQDAEAVAEQIKQTNSDFVTQSNDALKAAHAAGLDQMMAASGLDALIEEGKHKGDALGKQAGKTAADLMSDWLDAQIDVMEKELDVLLKKAEQVLTPTLQNQIRDMANRLGQLKADKVKQDVKNDDVLNKPGNADLAARAVAVETALAEESINAKLERMRSSQENKAKRAAEQERRRAEKLAEARIAITKDTIERLSEVGVEATVEDMRGRLKTLSQVSQKYLTESLEAYRKSLEADEAFKGQTALINQMVAIKQRELVETANGAARKILDALVTESDRLAKQANDALSQSQAMREAARAGQSTIAGEQNYTEADAFMTRQADEQQRLVDLQVESNILKDESARLAEIIALAEERSRLTKGQDVELEAKLLELKTRQADIEGRRAVNQRTLRALSQDESASLDERLAASYQMFQVESGGLKTLETQLVELHGSGLRGLRDGFSTMFREIATNSKTAGDALRGMVMKFAEALLDQAVQNAVASFMGMLGGGSSGGMGIFGILLSGIGSLFGGGGSLGRTGYTSGVMGPGGTMIGGRARGGPIPGVDIGRDNMLVPMRGGEYVLQPSAASSLGRDFLNRLNDMGRAAIPTQIAPVPVPGAGSQGVVNVWVVAPEERPQMGPNDIVATISQDILTGGTTKKLIRSVVTGAV